MTSPGSRSGIVSRINEDLLGPASENEELAAYPGDVYLTGILYPQDNRMMEDDTDQLQAEGVCDINSGDDAAEEVSLATTKRPASMGLSFAVRSDEVPVICLAFSGACYKEEEQPGAEESDEPDKVWKRIPLKWETQVALDHSPVDLTPSDTGIEGLAVHIRTSKWDGQLLVTVAVINQNKLPESYERRLIEPLCFFQTQLRVTPVSGTLLCSRPPVDSAGDEDSSMASLLYRDVVEYSVGHTCSADWSDDMSNSPAVFTSWIPSFVVPAVSSEGVEEFSPLSQSESGPVLSTEWLSETSGDALADGLARLPETYRKWLDSQEKRVDSLPESLCSQATEHLSRARHAADRMDGAIEKIRKDTDIAAAFRLANRAIMMQRAWGEPDGGALIWRPFQLGFVLLTLESLADGAHADRDTADLLWFPTGGGKTEAYLALIAFIIFYRRLKHRGRGLGVAAFMRYTLRLLTIQQFQRASAMICACDAIRLGDERPADLQSLQLGNSPIGIGLWVGGDATPNTLTQARKAMGDASAQNRPDQLKHCPCHQNRELRWAISDAGVSEYCPDEICRWH